MQTKLWVVMQVASSAQLCQLSKSEGITYYTWIFNLKLIPVKSNQCFLAESACSSCWTECPDSRLVLSDCFPSSFSSSSKNTGCLEFFVSSRVITCLPGLSKSHSTEQYGLDKGKQADSERGEKWWWWEGWEGGGQDGVEHVFEVALLIPIQMSKSTWMGEGGVEWRLEGGEGGSPRGKQAPLQQEATTALDPCDSSIVITNNFTFMVNDKICHVIE